MTHHRGNLLQCGLHLHLMLKLPQHGLPTALQVGLQDHPESSHVLEVVHLTLEIPEEEVPDTFVPQSSVEKETCQITVVVKLKLESLI